MIGTGGQSSGNFNNGVSTLGEITSAGADISILGQAGGTATSTEGSDGIVVFAGGQIYTTGTANIVMTGNGGSSPGANHGVLITDTDFGTRVSTEDGNVTVTGVGTGDGSGVRLEGSEISSSGMGTITVDGTGSLTGSGNANYGVLIDDFNPGQNSMISSNTGDIFINATGGADSLAFKMEDNASELTTTDGSITIVADSIDIQPAASITAGGENAVNILQETVGRISLARFDDDLGFELGITQAEFDRITAAEINIGDESKDPSVQVGDLTLTSDLNLKTLGPLNFIGNFDLGTSTLGFAGSPTFEARFNNASSFDQISITGEIDLTGLSFEARNEGVFTPSIGEQYVMVDNDGTDPIIGTFNGLAEGDRINDFLFSGLDAVVSYLGTDGTGNDMVLTVAAIDNDAPVVESVVINGGDVQRSMVREIELTFDEIVYADSSSFMIEDLDSGVCFNPDVTTEVVAGKTVATLTFSGAGIIGGSLADGNYRLTTLSTITDTSGNQLDGDATDDFFRLFGDANGSGNINIQDLLPFRNTYNRVDGDSAFNKDLDYIGDGTVNVADLLQFRIRYLTSV